MYHHENLNYLITKTYQLQVCSFYHWYIYAPELKKDWSNVQQLNSRYKSIHFILHQL